MVCLFIRSRSCRLLRSCPAFRWERRICFAAPWVKKLKRKCRRKKVDFLKGQQKTVLTKRMPVRFLIRLIGLPDMVSTKVMLPLMRLWLIRLRLSKRIILWLFTRHQCRLIMKTPTNYKFLYRMRWPTISKYLRRTLIVRM